jgi:hypothetical protein
MKYSMLTLYPEMVIMDAEECRVTIITEVGETATMECGAPTPAACGTEAVIPDEIIIGAV